MSVFVTTTMNPGDYEFALEQRPHVYTLFNVETCECCDCAILGANSITAKMGPNAFNKLGLKLAESMPEEGGYSDAFEGVTCLGCDSHTTRCVS